MEIQEQLEQLERTEMGLEILDKNPGALFLMERQPGDWRRSQDRFMPAKRKRSQARKDRHQSPEKEEMKHAGMRIWQQVNRLQRQVRFLRSQLDRTERDLQDLERIMTRIRDQHPELWEEIRKELPPPEPDHPEPPPPEHGHELEPPGEAIPPEDAEPPF
jgi:hypothetical protein